MPRASRHYIPGYVWHLTHRCHKKEFLLKFGRDRRRWLWWLFEAKKRYGLSVLGYTVTSNHIHLLVRDTGGKDVIAKSIQLIAGRTGQEFNLRKNRKGAFWEDRYHATAVETGEHLAKCLVYIDLNMVRAGIVKHPAEWPFCGYDEIQAPKERYALIDYNGLKDLFNFKAMDEFAEFYRGWIEDSLKKGDHGREGKWTESIAVGSESFVTQSKALLCFNVRGRAVTEGDGAFELRESVFPYNSILGYENTVL
ncbi:MAG: transposase, partial [Deltaproteobacteria bacterium]|nr:transposase [Deltaproteobacteria bacterium]